MLYRGLGYRVAKRILQGSYRGLGFRAALRRM